MEVCERSPNASPPTPLGVPPRRRVVLMWSVWTSGLVAVLGAMAVSNAWYTPAPAAHRRIVAIGDLHGDYAHALAIAEAAGLIAATTNVTWTGGPTVLVSTGDTVDRGDDTMAIYRFFQTLRTQSAAAGGEVHTLLGNHEMMNAMMDWRYVTPGDIHAFGGKDARRAAMSTTGWLGQEWLTQYTLTASIAMLEEATASIPSPRVSFVHGGIALPFAQQYGLDGLNTHGHRLLARALNTTDPTGFLPPSTTPDEQAIYSADGPLWYRGYALDPPAKACAHANATRETLGVESLVMGHTPHMGGIDARCDDAQLFVIDTGISRAYGGRLSALVIDTYEQRASRWSSDVCWHATYSALYVPGGLHRLSHKTRCRRRAFS